MAKKPPRAKTPAKKPVDAPANIDPKTTNETIDVSPRFKLVFTTIATMTVVCILASTLLAFREPTNPNIDKVVTGCMGMAAIGFGAICGLIGGKTL